MDIRHNGRYGAIRYACCRYRDHIRDRFISRASPFAIELTGNSRDDNTIRCSVFTDHARISAYSSCDIGNNNCCSHSVRDISPAFTTIIHHSFRHFYSYCSHYRDRNSCGLLFPRFPYLLLDLQYISIDNYTASNVSRHNTHNFAIAMARNNY